jgi:hypothetical protein
MNWPAVHGRVWQRRRLQEMPRHDRVDDLVAAVADNHRHAVMPNLSGIHVRLRRHDVIERCKAEPAAGQQEDAEILGVPVR